MAKGKVRLSVVRGQGEGGKTHRYVLAVDDSVRGDGRGSRNRRQEDGEQIGSVHD
jgi:hypothetical protein